MDKDSVQDYRQVVHDNLKILYMDGKYGGDGYLGMSLENLETNVLNMLEDCNNDVVQFKEAVSAIFGRPYDNPELAQPKDTVNESSDSKDKNDI